MRKNLLVVFLIVGIFFISGCDFDSTREGKSVTEVGVFRLSNSSTPSESEKEFHITAKKIKFEYDQRRVIIEDFVGTSIFDSTFTHLNDGFKWSFPAEIKDNNLLISIPSDSKYRVHIGDKDYYFFPDK